MMILNCIIIILEGVIINMDSNELKIERLQNNLLPIRKIIGWTTEDLANRIGVTKQTISNLENKKSKMTLTQYIAIRAILDYEAQTNEDMKEILPGIMQNLLDNDELSKEEEGKISSTLIQIAGVAAAGVTGASLISASTGLFAAANIAPLFGVGAVLGPMGIVVAGGAWLTKTIMNTNKKSKKK